jgi:hypothetical protein
VWWCFFVKFSECHGHFFLHRGVKLPFLFAILADVACVGWLSHRLPGCSLNQEQGLWLGKFGCGTVTISGLPWC